MSLVLRPQSRRVECRYSETAARNCGENIALAYGSKLKRFILTILDFNSDTKNIRFNECDQFFIFKTLNVKAIINK
jgi:hypothetical protein